MVNSSQHITYNITSEAAHDYTKALHVYKFIHIRTLCTRPSESPTKMSTTPSTTKTSEEEICLERLRNGCDSWMISKPDGGLVS